MPILPLTAASTFVAKLSTASPRPRGQIHTCVSVRYRQETRIAGMSDIGGGSGRSALRAC